MWINISSKILLTAACKTGHFINRICNRQKRGAARFDRFINTMHSAYYYYFVYIIYIIYKKILEIYGNGGNFG